MTVSYQYHVASSTSGGFTRLLFRWKGSLYKLVYRELVIFVICYGLMSILYRHILTVDQKRSFEKVVMYCDTFMNYIPLSFILGFYVAFVVSRWWQQYMAIPWPDKLLHSIALHVSGHDEKGRMFRRSMVRYLNLSFVLVLRSISTAVKRRFPTFDHIVEAGFMTATELEIYKTIPSTEFNTYWVPFTWFTALVREATYQKRLIDPMGSKLIMEMFFEFRAKCGLLWCYDWVVVTIATYSFFFACIIGRQYVERSPIPYRIKPDLYIPYFTLLQFFFYMGLLKVAEQLINPFGDDDEDFELNWIIDRHMKVSYLIVDTLMLRTPPLTKDIYFDLENPELPYTEAAIPFRKRAYRGSVANMKVPEDKQTFILPDIEEECDESEQGLAHRDIISGGLHSTITSMWRSVGVTPTSKTGSLMFQMPDGRATDRKAPSPLTSVISKLTAAIGTRSGSRLAVSAGTKGTVGDALVVVGTNQVLLATGLDLNPKQPENNSEYVALHMDTVTSDPRLGDSSVARNTYVPYNKPSSKLAASIRARLAMKKKPVMKWKPYQRPVERYRGVEEPLDDHLTEVCYEEECAFMWRTIDDDFDVSTPENSREFRLPTNETEKLHFEEHRILPNYAGTRPRVPKSKIISSNSPISFHPSAIYTQSPPYRRPGIRTFRPRRKAKGCPKCSLYYRSWPVLPCSVCGVPLSPDTVRCLSENSVFVDAIIKRLKYSSLSSNFNVPSNHHS
uniref:Bestrophin homolog n=3 Tax=Hirondellea gigas TaxID=1518452 RepID=A0A6A7FZC2_9CRUS